jgi:DNA-binding transcriptional ArsR family regulator
MRNFMAVTKALADDNRVRVLLALRGRELCVCQIIELLRLAPSTVSKHMTILHQARLIERRKKGRWVYYRLPNEDASDLVGTAIRWVDAALAGDPQIREDGKRLKDILTIDPEVLCHSQRENQGFYSYVPGTPAEARWLKDGHDTSKAM